MEIPCIELKERNELNVMNRNLSELLKILTFELKRLEKIENEWN